VELVSQEEIKKRIPPTKGHVPRGSRKKVRKYDDWAKRGGIVLARPGKDLGVNREWKRAVKLPGGT